MTRHANTPSYVTELPLEVDAEQERRLLSRLEAASTARRKITEN
jgi:hypothetical protein